MAGGMDLGTGVRGGKKPLDAAINLVPFIDLMAVTISFLIMTAVWTQVGRISVSQGGAGEATGDPVAVLEAHVTPTGLELKTGTLVLGTVKVTDDPKKLRDLLQQFRKEFPAAEQVTLTVDDDVVYDRVVRFIDVCVGEGLTNVNVAG